MDNSETYGLLRLITKENDHCFTKKIIKRVNMFYRDITGKKKIYSVGKYALPGQ
jgi:hypothetical protein